jgi:outer membrane receptor protein involved in Fe transport
LIADAERIDELCCGVANLLQGPSGGIIPALGGRLVANDAFAYENFQNLLPKNEIENAGVSLQADIDLSGDLQLTSITARRRSDQFSITDADYTTASLIGVEIDERYDTFTQELRLEQSRGPVDWMIGAFWLEEDIRFGSAGRYGADGRPYFDLLTGGAITELENALIGLGQLPSGLSFFGIGQGWDIRSEQNEETLSLFGQLDWELTDRLSLTAGLNYTEVDKAASLRSFGTETFSSLDLVQVGFGAAFSRLTGLTPNPANIAANPGATQQAILLANTLCTPQTGPACNPTLDLQPLQFFPPLLALPNAVESGKSNDSDITWTLRTAYRLNDRMLVYASAATGFKPTSWNLTEASRPAEEDLPAIVEAGIAVPNLTAGSRFAGPEQTTAYEIGFKGNWPRYSINLAVFDQAIEGFQTNVFTGSGFVLLNAGKQSTSGLEFDSVWLPADDWRIDFSATWLDPIYDSFTEGEGVGGPQDLSGRRPAGVSELSISTAATWSFLLGNVDAYLRGEYVFEDEVQVVENVPASVASRKVNLFNASAGLAWNNGWELQLWVRNLTDDEFLASSAFPAAGQPGTFLGYPNQPRTWGITGRVRF